MHTCASAGCPSPATDILCVADTVTFWCSTHRPRNLAPGTSLKDTLDNRRLIDAARGTPEVDPDWYARKGTVTL